MSTEDVDAVREKIWDSVYRSGECSLDDLAQQFGLSVPELLDYVQHEWFVVENQRVSIASGNG